MVMFGELLWSTRPMWVKCKQSEATSGKPLSPALHSGTSVSQSQTWASVSEMRESRDFRGQCFCRGWFPAFTSPSPKRMGRRKWRKEKERDTEARELGDVLKEEVVGGWVRNPPKGCTSKRKGMSKICGNYSKEERERESKYSHTSPVYHLPGASGMTCFVLKNNPWEKENFSELEATSVLWCFFLKN